MIQLSNGVKIFVNHSMVKDVYIGISNFGFEKDVSDQILGISHLLEHILISFDNKLFTANASTSRTYMSFWCTAVKRTHYEEAIKTVISWFFDKGELKNNFDDITLENFIRELENEYYYRTELYHCMDVLTYLYGGDLYNGGRITMLHKLDKVKYLLGRRMSQLSGKNIIIFVKKLNLSVLKLLNASFGRIPKYPTIILLDKVMEIDTTKVIMVPSPFYTLLIEVENILRNVLAIICLVENYHLIDYETIGDKLYISISFIEESKYEYFLYNILNIDFDIKSVELNLGEDYIMNLYINFPWLKCDLFQYIYIMTTNNKALITELKQSIYNSIQHHRFVIIYPSFTTSVYNIKDNQDHGLLIMPNVSFKKNNPRIPISNNHDLQGICYKKTPIKEVVLSYNDESFLKYMSAYHMIKSICIHTKFTYSLLKDRVSYKHNFDSDDLTELLNADTFIKYSHSKPAILYQYILLLFFITEKTIYEILGYGTQILQWEPALIIKNKIMFGKTVRYDIKTKSMFVCGILKGKMLDNKSMICYMWQLKRLGLIYSLDYTSLSTPHMYYIFMFTVYPEKVYTFFNNLTNITKYCLIVSHKNNLTEPDDYSALQKNIIINIK